MIAFLDNDIILKLVACDLFWEAMSSLNLHLQDLRVLADAKYVFQKSRRVKQQYPQEIREAAIAIVSEWNDIAKLGKVFDSSGGFKLPNGADRSPDASWVRGDRWEALTPEQRQKFPPICPDFVVELLSPTDSLKATQAKMREYLENGAHLGWLIKRKT